ncbi:MAG: hybrid sensor histidine kinase/response regulator [Bacteroidota bacterium]
MEKQQKIIVLYIDDEINNLNSFKATFRFDYTILLAQNAEEALNHLNTNNVQIILSDQRMPTITGVEFFEQIRESHPNAVRLLITGFSDIESVIDSINRGHIFRYIKKPWVELDVKSAIEEAYKFYLATSLLDEKNISLQKAYNELNKFAYSVAHDLKGPLVSVMGALTIVGQKEDPKERLELLDMIQSSLQKLQGFVDSMFDYYRLNQGELQIEEVNLEHLSQHYNDIYALEGKVKGIDFSIQTEQTKPFRSDVSKLKIILNNLIENAFKYQRTDATDKFVKVKLLITSELAEMIVEDNGIGIEEKYQHSIFDMFYRATTHAPGSGFGLYNAKDAITKLEGTLRVDSKPNEGSLFTVSIPTK